MKVNKGEGLVSINLSVQEDRFSRSGEKKKEENEKSKSVYAGNINLIQNDKIAEKKIKAQRDALKTIMDVFTSDQGVDTQQKESKNRISELEETRKKALEEIKKLDELGEQKDIDEMKDVWKRRYDDAGKEIKETRESIVEVELERLKSSPMVKAAKTADSILDSANKEIIDMLKQEAIDHIDKTLEENKKKAEQEDATNESKDTNKFGVDESNDVSEMNNKQNELSAEIKKLQKKLLEEDLKGIKVDKKS